MAHKTGTIDISGNMRMWLVLYNEILTTGKQMKQQNIVKTTPSLAEIIIISVKHKI